MCQKVMKQNPQTGVSKKVLSPKESSLQTATYKQPYFLTQSFSSGKQKALTKNILSAFFFLLQLHIWSDAHQATSHHL